ncbi:glutaredoxin domain-containing protein [Actinomyces faecalis]|uniref:glutaredoxin domain-containing protein n=1 Tax=Actinomyces faecalis TaxID=2722820 RepID=UPI001554DD90|nr:glutaredoxin domain-containing protein [Actinomyces faecalis]
MSASAPSPSSGSEPAVTIYSRHDCPGCALTQRSLAVKGVSFEVVDLDERPELVAELRQQGLTALPIIQTPDGQRTAGFRPDRIKAIIAMATTASPAQTPQPSSGDERPPVRPGPRTGRGMRL